MLAAGAPDVEVSQEAAHWEGLVEVEPLVRRAVAAAADAIGVEPSRISLSVLLCDDAAIQALNLRFRGVDAATNVLAWPAFSLDCPMNLPDFEAAAQGPEQSAQVFMGDIALAFETMSREAVRDGKPLEDHFAHLIVHAVLHLFGYDHDIDSDAEVMEQRERVALASLDVPDPYAIDAAQERAPLAEGSDSG